MIYYQQRVRIFGDNFAAKHHLCLQLPLIQTVLVYANQDAGIW